METPKPKFLIGDIVILYGEQIKITEAKYEAGWVYRANESAPIKEENLTLAERYEK